MSRLIKAILPPKRPNAKTTVVFDDGSVMKLIPAVAADQGLYPGMELETADLDRLRAANGAASARQRAVRIISAAGVSKRDLEERLTRRGEDPRDAHNAVQWLSDLDLLDDAETARQIVARGVNRGYGAERIRQMLYEKRIPKQYWDEALAQIPDMTDALTDFLQKRLGEDSDEKQRRSAVNAALRRGYTWQEVRSVMERIRRDTEE